MCNSSLAWKLAKVAAALVFCIAHAFAAEAQPPNATDAIKKLTFRDAVQLVSQHRGKTLSLNGLEELPRKVAEALAQHDGTLSLNGLTNLLDSAGALAKHKGELRLDGLSQLWDIPGHSGPISFGGVKRVRADRLVDFASRHQRLRLDGLTTIELDVHPRPANNRNRANLVADEHFLKAREYFDSEAEEEELRLGLSLNGVTSLPPQAAKVLAQHPRFLSLDGLKNLDLKPQGQGPHSPDKEMLMHLAKHGGGISLDGVSEIDLRVARAFGADGNTGNLSLNGLTKLSPEEAEVLSKRNGYLKLDGIAILDEPTANGLANHKHALSLNGLQQITPSVAEALSRHKGGLRLDGLKSLGNGVAGALANHTNWLSLKGLKALAPGDVDGLMHHGGGLSLAGLESLSADDADKLARGKNWLSLNGLKRLEDGVARNLGFSKDERKIYLFGIEELTPEQANHLLMNRNIAVPEKFRPPSSRTQ